MNKKTMQAGNGGAAWQDYVDDMRDQKPEQYLAGDIEGYRRGYGDGVKAGERRTVDHILAGAVIVALVWFTLGVFVGSVLT